MKFEGLNVKIRDVQLVGIDILLEFDRICKKHDLPYLLYWGTLLGAVRQKGFIPWDDDIDVCMLRKDYEKFAKVCETELRIDYFLQNEKTDSNYYLWFPKLRKNNTSFIQKIFKGFDMHHGIPISIIPLDNVLPNRFIGAMQRFLLSILYFICIKIDGSRSWDNIQYRDSMLERNSRRILFFISKLIPKKMTDNLRYKLANMFNSQETEYVTALMFRPYKKDFYNNIVKRDEFLNPVFGDFEGQRFPIPKSYDTILKNMYGNYMILPPHKQRVPHHGVIEINLEKV